MGKPAAQQERSNSGTGYWAKRTHPVNLQEIGLYFICVNPVASIAADARPGDASQFCAARIGIGKNLLHPEGYTDAKR
jgi:hypothetical protein